MILQYYCLDCGTKQPPSDEPLRLRTEIRGVMWAEVVDEEDIPYLRAVDVVDGVAYHLVEFTDHYWFTRVPCCECGSKFLHELGEPCEDDALFGEFSVISSDLAESMTPPELAKVRDGSNIFGEMFSYSRDRHRRKMFEERRLFPKNLDEDYQVIFKGSGGGATADPLACVGSLGWKLKTYAPAPTEPTNKEELRRQAGLD